MDGSKRSIAAGAFWAFAAVGIWSGSLVMLRLGVTTGLNAYDLTMLRFGTAALVLAPVIVRRGLGLPQLGWRGVAVIAAGFGAPYIVLISVALQTAPASAAGALNPGIMAVATVALSWWIMGDRIGSVRIIGAALVLSGCVWSVVSGGGATVGYAILVGTGMMWAVYALTVRRSGVSALHATAIVSVVSAIAFLPVYVVLLPKQIGVADLRDVIGQAAFHGLLVSTIAVFAFNRAAELLGPVTGAGLTATIPMVTMGLGLAMLGEMPTMPEAMAAVVIGAGVLLILMQRRRRTAAEG